MGLLLSSIGKKEKNKLSTDSQFAILLKINLAEEVNLCYSNQDIYWDGKNWVAFPMKIGDNTEDNTGSDPNLTLQVDNVSRALQGAIQNGGGGVGTKVQLYVVNTKNLASATAEFDDEYVVINTKENYQYINFTLGNEYSARTRRPLDRYFKDFCPFKYKGIRCGYCGDKATCNKTLLDCREHGNSARFGGFPGIDQKGIYM
ncbi:MAG: hypothetical protein KBS60_01170 [Phascolarctobacterium sp.]|nr:hypothetical protein [Candidatus Phascolarctobacterium caballi]